MRGLLCLALAGLACAPSSVEVDAGAQASSAGDDAGVTDGGPLPAGDGGVRLETVQARAVESLCHALGRCCDAQSTVRFFGPMTQSQRLPAALRARLPTDGGISRTECEQLLGEVYDVLPVGSWVRAVQKGLASFDAAAAQDCLATLDAATCGAQVADALHDGTCFGFGPPAGGSEQRRPFRRTASQGQACEATADGVGGSFFGTCDPSVAFCCGPRPDGSCGLVGDVTGECRLAAQVGQSCGLTPSVTPCATGLECDPGTGKCVAPLTGPLQVGATCVNGSSLLGECVDSWCDFGASKTCQPPRVLGANCQYGWQCASGECAASQCVAARYCVAP